MRRAVSPPDVKTLPLSHDAIYHRIVWRRPMVSIFNDFRCHNLQSTLPPLRIYFCFVSFSWDLETDRNKERRRREKERKKVIAFRYRISQDTLILFSLLFLRVSSCFRKQIDRSSVMCTRAILFFPNPHRSLRVRSVSSNCRRIEQLKGALEPIERTRT